MKGSLSMSWLSDGKKTILCAILTIMGLGFLLFSFFSGNYPNDREIARAYDNNVGVEASQCKEIAIFPYEGGLQSPAVVSQAPHLKASICSFVDKRKNQVSSGVLVKSSDRKQWIAVSHFASYAGNDKPLLPTRSPTPILLTKQVEPQMQPHIAAPQAPRTSDSADDLRASPDNFSIGYSPTIPNYIEGRPTPSRPVIQPKENATEDVSSQN